MTQEQDASAPDNPEQEPFEAEEFFIDDPDDNMDLSPTEVAEDLMTPEEVEAQTAPTESEEPAAEPEPEPEPEVEAESDAGPTPDASDEEPTDGPAPGTPDPYVQKLAQRQSATDAKMDQILQLLQARQEPAAPAAEPGQQEEAVSNPDEFEDAMAELLKLTEDQDELDELSRGDFAKMAAAQARVFRAMRNDKAPAPTVEGLAEVKAYIEQQQRESAAKQGWAQFQEEHGYDGKSVWEEALDQASTIYPDDQNARNSLAQRYFQIEVEKRDAAPPSPSKADSKPTPAPNKVPPASSKTRRPATGTQTTPPGATGAGSKKDPKAPIKRAAWLPG